MAGEHLTGLELIKAIEILSKTFDLNARQFIVLPTIRGNYVYHHWYVSSKAKSPAELMADSIDTTLKVNNYDYKSVRDSGVLSGPKVTIVEDDAFNNWLKNLGKYGNQNKLPMILNALQSRQWKEFISENEM